MFRRSQTVPRHDRKFLRGRFIPTIALPELHSDYAPRLHLSNQGPISRAREHSARDPQPPRLRHVRADSGRNTAISNTGQPSAGHGASSTTHDAAPAPEAPASDAPVAATPDPSSSRTATTVAVSGLASATAPSHAGIVDVSTNTPDRNSTGHTATCTALTDSWLRTRRPMNAPIHRTATRSNTSSPSAPHHAPTPASGRQPKASPAATTIASPTSELSTSTTHRPARTEAPDIGSDRSRSVTPREASSDTAVIVDSRPKNIVIASTPGIR